MLFRSMRFCWTPFHISTVLSFYVLAPKWPYKVTSYIQIDGDTIPLLVDMQDYHSDVDVGPTIAYSVVASWIGTVSEEHTLRISSANSYGIVDAIMQVFM